MIMAERPPPELMDELVEEILLCIPPNDPARLVRAAVACKRWCHLVGGPAFRRRFRELHRTPPMLGAIRVSDNDDHYGFRAGVTSFVPTCPILPPRAGRIGWRWRPHDSHAAPWRVGRSGSPNPLAVWDPITDELRELPTLPLPPPFLFVYLHAAVLCAAAAGECDCDHLDCRRGPFIVLLVGIRRHHQVSTCIYSSEADAWSEPTPAPNIALFIDETVRSVHVGKALYFVIRFKHGILKYDFGTRETIVIDTPPMSDKWIVLTNAEGGGELGCVTVEDARLCLWSLVSAGPNDRDMRWAQRRVIEFKKQVPAGVRFLSVDLVSFADVDDAVVLGSKDGHFITDLKSGSFTKLGGISRRLGKIIPYVAFCMPALRVASTSEGPGAGASS